MFVNLSFLRRIDIENRLKGVKFEKILFTSFSKVEVYQVNFFAKLPLGVIVTVSFYYSI